MSLEKKCGTQAQKLKKSIKADFDDIILWTFYILWLMHIIAIIIMRDLFENTSI